MGLKTMFVFQKASGRQVTINAKDFDPELYSETAPEPAPAPKSKREPEPEPEEPKAEPEPPAPRGRRGR